MRKMFTLLVLISVTILSCNKKEGDSKNDLASTSTSGNDMDRTILPIPEPAFKGKIGDYYGVSEPDYPRPVTAPEGAPNIVVIMTDDVGFGASSLYGGPVETPNFERLANRGIMYTQFHTTALCSPTRAALITGRNHHTASTGIITEMASGFPGYNSLMSKSCGTIGQILKYNGYNTSWFGKNHNVPDFQSSQSGPFDLWPTDLGFEYFYGFIGADANQWYPAAFEGTKPIDPYLGKKEGEYHFDEDMADHAVHYIQQQKALSLDKPFFMYYAPGTAHAPHHAPKEWIEKYKGSLTPDMKL
ncbi:sulfatase-like hydrolase/transferase [Flavobacterium sp.]|uniref:sulfatase-like hydrolase/transferase n=1 Tax=Flavobacterium sp. TaxID=239 RepID=UPI003A937F48